MSESECSSFQIALDKVVDIWIEFNELEFFHDQVVEILRNLRIRISRHNTQDIQDEYPENDYLRSDALTAAKMLYEMDFKELLILLGELEFHKKYSVYYSSMRRWIRDSISRIKTCGNPKGYLLTNRDIERMKVRQTLANDMLENGKQKLDAYNNGNREIFAKILTREA